jgi:hypothetical protein
MIQLILGEKGKGKTKILLDKVNSEVKTAHGNIVYLDKSTKHMFELNNKVRLIDVSSFELTDSDEFIGFIYGIISQDNDLEQMYLDSFLTIAVAEEDKVNDLFTRLAKIGEKYQITFVVSASVPGSAVADEFRDSIIAEL